MKRIQKGRAPVWLAAVFVLCLLCGCSRMSSGESCYVKDVMIPNGEGTFTRAQIVVPADYEDYEGKEDGMPAVVLGHGFRGTMNSAGAEMLSHALAEAGIGTIRMDFSHYVSENPQSAQTSQYTVESMTEDLALCAAYMTENCCADADRIGVFGRSLGGRAAMACVNERAGGFDYKALVLVAPAGNKDAFQRYMGGQKKWENFQEQAVSQGSVIHQNVVLTPAFFQQIENYVPSEHGYKFERPVLVAYNTEDHVVLPQAAVECAEGYPDHRLIEVTSKKSPHGLEMGFENSEIKDMLFEEITEFYIENL